MSAESHVELPAAASRAVFLSYARDDAAAARRIAEALRSGGVEVWFDQNDLRGGDAWDQKIRRQIDACALFVPIISQHTQERAKGYFRLEWKLAVEQTHLMVAGMAFLAPVVIDDTPEAGAVVPPEFMRVQWTRLPGGLPTPQFIEQIRRLLSSPVAPSASMPPFPLPAAAPGRAPAAQSRFPIAIVAALGLAVLALTGYIAIRPAAKESPAASQLATAGLVPLSAAPSGAPAPPPAVDSKSIAVLPFANFSTERENVFFADGVQDDVITALAKIHDLTVISRTSTLAYRDPGTRNLKKIAAELGVATVLEGSVERVGSKVHMNAQLIDAQTDAHLWADTFDGDASDLFALQASLAQKIAVALKATLTASERTLIERRPTQNQRAYELYLRARAMQQELGEGGSAVVEYERVIAAYDLALAEDPHFALAYAQVALVNSILYWFGNLDPSPARRERMKAAVDAALRYAPDAPETRLAVGAYHYRVELDWARALTEFRVAEASLPNDAQLAFWLAITHRRLGHWSESLREFERAAAHDPRDLATVSNYASFLFALRRWDQARESAARYLAYFPNDRSLAITYATSRFALDGDRDALARALEKLPSSPADPDVFGGRYAAALIRDDIGVAKNLLVNSPDRAPTAPGGVITDANALHRASVEYLRGDNAAASRAAQQAIAYYKAETWNARQIPWAHMRIAQALAWAGRTDEAVSRARAAQAENEAQDAFDAATMRPTLGVVLLAAGHREEALACLREMMQSPCAQSPNQLRVDRFWAPLKDDPRFEEILRSARPL